jgi:NAD(P)H dehydrogenase (quinone)
MILISGASGKSGVALLRALARRSIPARALVHRPEQVGEALSAGAVEALCGDLENASDLERALQGVEKVYHICPNMHPLETQIGMRVVEAAKGHGVSHFVYHSVLHPQIEAMPHHWNKLRVEEYLFTSGLPFTILQPCAYMQNIEGYMPAITREGVYAVPYAPETPISIVDLEDVAAAAAQVLREDGHQGAIYELVGPQPLSQVEVARVLAQVLGRSVNAQALDRAVWIDNARRGGMASYALDTLVKMFEYYEQFGFTGSPRVLEWLLGRPPVPFEEYVRRNLSGDRSNG